MRSLTRVNTLPSPEDRKKGTGYAQLSLLPFQELHALPPDLEPLLRVVEELSDLAQRSYRIRLEEPRWVFLEAAGRSLADLCLWRDRQWLVYAEPVISVVEPEPGEPLRRVRQHVFLQPGEYLLTAYGGPRLPWASGEDTDPFHLRMDVPRLPVAGRFRQQVGPTGADLWLVPGDADFFRLELERPGRAELAVVDWETGDETRAPVSRGVVTRETLPPVAELRLGDSRDGLRLVSVRAEAGTGYVLQHFEIRWSWEIFEQGRYWLAALFAGDPSDRPDATGILTELPRPGERRRRLLTSQTVELAGRGERRRFNLVGPLTLQLHASASGRYRVEVQGTAARLRLQPFVASRGSDDPDLEPEPWRSGSGTWDLEKGFYVLELEPMDAVGVVDLSVGPETLANTAVSLPRGMVQLGVVDLQSQYGHELFLGQSEISEAGLVLREVPLDLEEPLPLEVTPGQAEVLPVVSRRWGLLRAIDEDGKPLEVSVDGSPWQEKWAVSPGEHRVEVRAGDDQARICSVALTPLEQIPGGQRAAAADVKVPGPSGASLTTLSVGDPVFFDLGNDEEQMFLLEAEEAGFYRVESSGLLDLEGKLRTRTIPVLARASGGGSGRNFLIQEYLRPGEYLLSVSTRGDSRGRAAVRLSRTSLRNTEAIAPERPARSHLAAGEGAVYHFRVSESERYRISSLSAGGGLARIRLEDGSGWPVVKPGQRTDLVRELESGDYRLIVLPEAVDGYRLTVLSQLKERPRFEGHGPAPAPAGNPGGACLGRTRIR